MSTGTLPPVTDVRDGEIGEDALAAFLDAGALIVRGLVGAEELQSLQRDTALLIDRACRDDIEDVRHATRGGVRVPFRVEYVVDKLDSAKALLGHPVLLRAVEGLQGREFIPTWDSIVFKLPGAGAEVPWHRDTGSGVAEVEGIPIFNADVYLDAADEDNCVWVVPGSNRWDAERTATAIAGLRGDDGFRTDGAVPALMRPGDVLLHDVRVVHGSAASTSGLRRVIYLEFRPVAVELEVGPHTAEYIPLKQQLLRACIRRRSKVSWAAGEHPYVYAVAGDDTDPPTFRYRHEEYWRL